MSQVLTRYFQLNEKGNGWGFQLLHKLDGDNAEVGSTHMLLRSKHGNTCADRHRSIQLTCTGSRVGVVIGCEQESECGHRLHSIVLLLHSIALRIRRALSRDFLTRNPFLLQVEGQSTAYVYRKY